MSISVNFNNTLKVTIPSEAILTNFEIYKKKHNSCTNNHGPTIFPVSKKNSLCFPCLEKLRTKFPVFPVLWPPCHGVSLMKPRNWTTRPLQWPET